MRKDIKSHDRMKGITCRHSMRTKMRHGKAIMVPLYGIRIQIQLNIHSFRIGFIMIYSFTTIQLVVTYIHRNPQRINIDIGFDEGMLIDLWCVHWIIDPLLNKRRDFTGMVFSNYQQKQYVLHENKSADKQSIWIFATVDYSFATINISSVTHSTKT